MGSFRKILCLEHKGHRFLAPDNGALSQILDKVKKPVIFEVTRRRYALETISNTFHGRDIFAPAAGHLSKGVEPHQLGPRVKTFQRLSVPRTLSAQKSWTGQVIHIDRFGNAVTNLPWNLFKERNRESIRIRVKGHVIEEIRLSYNTVRKDIPLGIIGSHGLLEIAVNGGSAARRLRLKVGNPVEVRI